MDKYVFLAPGDAARGGFAEGDLVRVFNKAAYCLARVKLSSEIRTGALMLTDEKAFKIIKRRSTPGVKRDSVRCFQLIFSGLEGTNNLPSRSCRVDIELHAPFPSSISVDAFFRSSVAIGL
jgi:anaerobic selenocysteine-containing dehydrogenase